MHLKNNILNNRSFLFYLPIILFVIHTVMTIINFDIWLNIMTPLIFIINSLTLIHIYNEKTKNHRSVFFFSLGIFIFGIAEVIWVIMDKILLQNPVNNIFLSYLYVIPNLCFVTAVVIYFIVNMNIFHPAQMKLDISVVSVLTISTITILFFKAKVFGSVDFSAFDISQFLYLALDATGISIMIFLFISSRSQKFGIYNLITFLGILLYFISDILYVSGVINNTYVPSTFIDWLYMFSLILVSLSLKILWLKNKEVDNKTETPYLNEGRVKYVWFVFGMPVLVFIINGINLTELIFFCSIITSYLVLSLYIQNNIANEKLLKSKTTYNKILEKQIKERTLQLESANKNLKYLLQHDSLTGLLSRQRFFELIDKQIKKCQYGTNFYLITIDVDKFRIINEVYGFNIGDKVLKRISALIKENFYDNSYIGRTEISEFSVLCFDTEFEEINIKLQKIYFILRNSFKVSTYQLSVNVRIGIAEYPKNALNRTELINCSKASLLYSKNLSSSGYYLFDEEIENKIRRNFNIEMELRKADINSEFDLHFQPIYDISGKNIKGLEALLRWSSPNLGQVSPAEFIPIAEETGIILVLGEWVMKNAMRYIKEFNNKCNSNLFVGINISPIQLKNTNFIDKVRELIFELGVMPNWLNFEITENLKITDQDEKTLAQLTSMGINLSIDDFGHGYSSYNYLNKFSFDYLKISKDLIDNITFKQKDAQIVKSIITMAKILNIKVLAEGVENNQQMQLLHRMGCDYIQGFIYAKPVSVSVLLNDYINKK